MKGLSNDIKGIASLTLFSEMRRANIDILDLIEIMAISSVKVHSRRRYTVNEINSWIKEEYGFKLPISVLQGALHKRKSFIKQNQYYSLEESALNESTEDHDKNLQTHKAQAEEMLSDLINFAKSETGSTYSEKDQKELKNSLFNLLLESHHVDKYSPLVAKFVLSRSANPDFKNQLNSIAEGLIIFIGLSHNELKGTKGEDSISGTLTLVLDTEILYHLMGYHSSIYKDLAMEFYSTIAEYNSLHYEVRGANAIRLCYLPETKMEIDEKFSKAEKIKRGGVRIAYHTTALQHMLEQCADVTDVAFAKDKFWRDLRDYGIKEYSETIRDSESKVIEIPDSLDLTEIDSTAYGDADGEYVDDFQYNVLSLKDLDNVSDAKAAAVYYHLARLNKINSMRRGVHSTRELEKCGVILVTGTSIVLTKSKEVYLDKNLKFGYRLADTMQSITCKIWLKLNKGFAADFNLLNIDLIIKSKLILASRQETILRRQFDNLTQQYKDGKVSRDQVAYQIVVMRQFSTLPDAIQSIDDAYITEDEFEVKAAYAMKEKQEAEDTIKRKDKLIDKVIERMRVEEQNILDEKYEDKLDEWLKVRDKYVNSIRNRYYLRILEWIIVIGLITFGVVYSAYKSYDGILLMSIFILIGIITLGIKLKNDSGLRACLKFCNRQNREDVLRRAQEEFISENPIPQKTIVTKQEILRKLEA